MRLSFGRRVAVVAIAAALLPGVLATAASAASGQIPVSYNFLGNAFRYGLAPNPPGGNIWTCRPSAAHPEPVVLVPGTGGDDADNWATYSALLHDNGYCVFALTYGVAPGTTSWRPQIGGMNTIESSAAQLSSFVAKVLAATHAAKVDLVGHSQGTLMPDYYVKFLGGARYVDKYVSLAPLWHGEGLPQTDADMWALIRAAGLEPAYLPFCRSCTEMVGGSEFLTKLGAGGFAVKGVTYTNIITEHDDVVLPYWSGIEAGMKNIILQTGCPQDLADHLEIASDRRASVLVLNALDPAHPRPVPCELSIPAV